MKIISHRGNINGPLESRENSPSYIDTAISAGYDVEVDIRLIGDVFYLGHDRPDYAVSETWLEKRKDNLWLHCKNLQAATKLSNMGVGFNYFAHTSDAYVLTSNRYVWVHDLTLKLNDKCIIPLLNYTDVSLSGKFNVFGICTDHVKALEKKYNNEE